MLICPNDLNVPESYKQTIHLSLFYPILVTTNESVRQKVCIIH